LGIKVREVASLQKRVIGEPNTRDNMGGTESHLLDLSKELWFRTSEPRSQEQFWLIPSTTRSRTSSPIAILGTSSSGQSLVASRMLPVDQSFVATLNRIDALKIKGIFFVRGNNLNRKCPFRRGATIDSVFEIFAMEVGVLSAKFLGYGK
jgi:hypothetical protein